MNELISKTVEGKVLKEKKQIVKEDVVTTDLLKLKHRMYDDNHSESLQKEYTHQETEMAFRNHGMHYESLGLDVTPIGMHYLLQHFDVPFLDEKSYTLEVKGMVSFPTIFSLEEIKKFPQVTLPILMECAGNGRTKMRPRFNKHVPWSFEAVSQSEWTGCYLKDVLQKVGLFPDTVDLVFTGEDWGVVDEENQQYHEQINPRYCSARYFQRSLNLKEDKIWSSCLLAYEMNGQPLPYQHGHPLRLIVPGVYGMASVKWLKSIEAVPYRFKDHFMQVYTYVTKAKDEGVKEPVFYIRPRALLKPPGVPHFFKRIRYVPQGKVTLEGRAWVGGTTEYNLDESFFNNYLSSNNEDKVHSPKTDKFQNQEKTSKIFRDLITEEKEISINKVELSFDQGLTWQTCNLQDRKSKWGWYKWTLEWEAKVGIYVLTVRATDSEGYSQKIVLDQSDWNYHGMANTKTQDIAVEVIENLQPDNQNYFIPQLDKVEVL